MVVWLYPVKGAWQPASPTQCCLSDPGSLVQPQDACQTCKPCLPNPHAAQTPFPINLPQRPAWSKQTTTHQPIQRQQKKFPFVPRQINQLISCSAEVWADESSLLGATEEGWSQTRLASPAHTAPAVSLPIFMALPGHASHCTILKCSGSMIQDRFKYLISIWKTSEEISELTFLIAS